MQRSRSTWLPVALCTSGVSACQESQQRRAAAEYRPGRRSGHGDDDQRRDPPSPVPKASSTRLPPTSASEASRSSRATVPSTLRSETGYADVPLATINALSPGNHTIYVRGKDAAGNWGATRHRRPLLIDKTAPTFTSISLAPNPTLGAANVTLTVNGAADPLVGGSPAVSPAASTGSSTTAPAPGGGTPFTGLTPASRSARWPRHLHGGRPHPRRCGQLEHSAPRSATVSVVPDAIFSNGFETGSQRRGVGQPFDQHGARLNVTAAAALVGTRRPAGAGQQHQLRAVQLRHRGQPCDGDLRREVLLQAERQHVTDQDIFVAATTRTVRRRPCSACATA